MRYTCILLWIFFASNSLAQQSLSLPELARNMFDEISYEECISAQERFQIDVLTDLSDDVPIYIRRSVASSFSHFCEAKRYTDEEIPRIQTIIEETTRKAADIEQQWQVDHAADPLGVPDSDGRDRSQERMYADIGRQRTQIELHMREYRRLTQLAVDDLILAANGDPDAADDIIRRMLGTLPPSVLLIG